MNQPVQQTTHGLFIYTPDLLSKEQLVQQFVARRALLERLLENLRLSPSEGGPHHHLLVGQRGMGKTTLLRRLRFAIDDDPVLSKRWVPLVFPEEQYNVARLSDLWLNCVDALSDALELRGRAQEVERLDRQVAVLSDDDEEARARGAMDVLTQWAKSNECGLVLLLDNVDLVFDRLKEHHWTIREILSHSDRLVVIGASTSAIEATFDYQAAFYDFFEIHELRGLNAEESREVLVRLGELENRPHVIRQVDRDPGRLRTLHVLTGGNPRTLVVLYSVMAADEHSQVRENVERLLDQCTPLYKARFEALAAQAQQVLDGLALNWDPMTAAELAKSIRLETSKVSAQLDRLTKEGIVEKVAIPPARRVGYQVAERFFNIWYLMRASRRVRRKLIWLVEFLKLFYGAKELATFARDLVRKSLPSKLEERAREAELAMAYAESVGEPVLVEALQSKSVELLLDVSKEHHRRLADILDLDEATAHLKPVADRMEALDEIRNSLLTAKIEWPGRSVEQVWELLAGSISIPLDQKRAVSRALGSFSREQLSMFALVLDEEFASFSKLFRDEPCKALWKAIGTGVMADSADVRGADVAAIRFDCPTLSAIARAVRLEKETDQTLLAELERFLPETEAPYLWLFWAGKAAQGNINADRIEWACSNALRLDSFSADEWTQYGTLLNVQLRRFEEAEAAYRKAAELDPKDARPWNDLGNLLSDLKRYAEAEAAYRKALEIEPANPSRQNSLAWHLYQTNSKLDEAEKLARQAVDRAPKEMHFAHTLACITLRRGNWVEAGGLARRFISEGDAAFHERTWQDIVTFFREAVRMGHAADAVKLLDEIGFGERWRPLREALQAAAKGSADYLMRIAPEVRLPAEELLTELLHEPSQTSATQTADTTSSRKRSNTKSRSQRGRSKKKRR